VCWLRYDPLINWRLLTPNGPDGPKEGEEAKLDDENVNSGERSAASDEDNEQDGQGQDQEGEMKVFSFVWWCC
jgi:hypothetical protein